MQKPPADLCDCNALPVVEIRMSQRFAALMIDECYSESKLKGIIKFRRKFNRCTVKLLKKHFFLCDAIIFLIYPN
jgi:hypothetical protein